ncbi:MAG: HlyD family efflux transporter periplasmic adaptor subunit [Actinomycetota bacterium]
MALEEGTRMSTKAKRRAGVGLLLTIGSVAVALGLIRPQFGSADDSTVSSTTVATGTLSVTVTGSGTIVDRYTYSVGPGTSALVEQAGVEAGNAVSAVGYTTVRLEVSTGEHVTAGDHLAVVKDVAGEAEAVKAPVAGYVRTLTTSKAASAGQVATIGGGGQLASVAVSEYDIAEIRTGQKVSVTLSSLDRTVTGKVESIGQTADDSSGVQQYRVLVSVPDLPDKARIGMSATAEIVTASKQDVLLTPATAITEAGDRTTVELLRDDGTTQVVPIEVGLVGSSQVEVLDGLEAGDEVVTGTEGTVPDTSSNPGFPAGGPPGGVG